MSNKVSKGLLVLISGPSGVGKGTIMKLIRERMKEVVFLLSETTRQMRVGEKNGQQYNFVTKQKFEENIKKGLFLEWAIVHEKDYYGVLRESLQKNLDANKLIVKEVDVQGVRNIKKVLPQELVLTIFIAPENEDVLISRIAMRGEMSDEELSRRMLSMRKEMIESEKYDYKVINYEGQIERCYSEIESIIRNAAKCRGIN